MRRRNDVVKLGLVAALSGTACGGGSFAANPGAGGDAGAAGDATANGGATHTGGTGTGGTILGGAPVPLDEYPAAVAGAVCPPLSGCCTTLGVTLTADQCTTTLLGLSNATTDADPTKYTYDPVAAGVCIAAARNTYSSTCTVTDANTDLFCSNVFTGQVAPGEPCNAKVECAHQTGDSVSCKELVTGAGNVCVIERRATADQPCFWTCTEQAGGVRICSGNGSDQTAVQGRCFTNDGLYCADDGVCRPQGRINDPCSGSDSCAEGFCNTSTSLCTVKAAQGGACVSTDGCAENLYCKSQLCTPDLPAGSACTFSDRCLNGSCQTNVCVANATTDPNQLGMAFLCAILSGALQTQ